MGTGTLIVFLYGSCCVGITTVGIVAAVMIAMGRNERRRGDARTVYQAMDEETSDDNTKDDNTKEKQDSPVER